MAANTQLLQMMELFSEIVKFVNDSVTFFKLHRQLMHFSMKSLLLMEILGDGKNKLLLAQMFSVQASKSKLV